MNQSMKKFGSWGLALGLLLAAAVVVGWWLSEPAVHADKPGPVEPGVVAVVGGEKLTEADIETALASEFRELERQRHQLLEKGLEKAIADKLVALESAKRGVSGDELISQEVEAKIQAPTDAEVDAFYEERKDQISQPKEQVAPRIRDFLRQQRGQELYAGLIESLKGEYGVRTYLEPLRVEVADAGAPAKGPADAPVTIIEFSDFECPYCSRVTPTLERVTKEYGEKVRLVFRQFPLNSIHPNAQKAAEASLCAHAQGRFWDMHDTMFKEQRALGVDQLKQKAARLELDTEEFNTCLDSGRYAAQVAADLEAGAEAGVSGTPAMFVNGRFLSGAQPYEAIAEVIDDELARAERR